MSRSRVFFLVCLNATIPLTCTLANEYTSSNEISKKNGTVRRDCIACVALLRYRPGMKYKYGSGDIVRK